MLVTIHTSKTVGTKGVPVNCECDIQKGIGIHLVGLADVAVKEALLRTVTAIQAVGYHVSGKKVIINLAPSDLIKSGTGYDLAIAIGLIGASEQEYLRSLDNYIVLGELSLDGSVRDVPGWMQAADIARQTGKALILPFDSALQAAEIYREDLAVYGVNHLQDVVDILNGNTPEYTAFEIFCKKEEKQHTKMKTVYWDEIRGQDYAKRALEIAAAGGHNILMIGAPGSGKSTLARAFMDILPPISKEKAFEIQRIYSAAGRCITPGERPFRAPYRSCSMAALLGGGIAEGITPGEVSLASGGVLHIDEFIEMPKSRQEGLRGPLEDRKVVISRLKSKVEFPADFQLVATTNPCPCGYYGEGDRCTCTHGQRTAYLSHLSGPVYDMIDVQVWTHPENPEAKVSGDPANIVRERVGCASDTQMKRQGKLNRDLTAADMEKYCHLDPVCKELVENLLDHLGLSARAYSRILKIARTIADLDGCETVEPRHLSEASTYRFLDRRETF